MCGLIAELPVQVETAVGEDLVAEASEASAQVAEVMQVQEAMHTQQLGNLEEYLASIADDWDELPSPTNSPAHESESDYTFVIPEAWTEVRLLDALSALLTAEQPPQHPRTPAAPSHTMQAQCNLQE